MGDDSRSFQELYRANQQRAEADRAAARRETPGGSTISLTDAIDAASDGARGTGALEGDASLFDFSAELSAPEAELDALAATGSSLFERRSGDLGGLADPNQPEAGNPYDSRASLSRR